LSVELRGEAAEVALGEAQAVLSMVQDPERRARLADLVAAVGEGVVDEDEAQTLEEILELGLQTGRVRQVYGPGGEQAALRTYRRLPRGRELGESTRAVSEALGALSGRTLESISLQSTGPGAYSLNVNVDGRELTVKFDRQGARLGSVVL
jgi:hypothetical protein